jgi:hypothetical protein
MKLLVDECVDERLRLLFPGHDCQTARFANLAGLKNGRLLEAAEEAGIDVMITRDYRRERAGKPRGIRTGGERRVPFSYGPSAASVLFIEK